MAGGIVLVLVLVVVIEILCAAIPSATVAAPLACSTAPPRFPFSVYSPDPRWVLILEETRQLLWRGLIKWCLSYAAQNERLAK